MSWQVRWQAASRKDLARLDLQTQDRIIAAVERLSLTGQGDVIRLTDVEPPEWRLRIGKWRVRFRRDVEAHILDVLRVLPRDKAY